MYCLFDINHITDLFLLFTVQRNQNELSKFQTLLYVTVGEGFSVNTQELYFRNYIDWVNSAVGRCFWFQLQLHEEFLCNDVDVIYLLVMVRHYFSCLNTQHLPVWQDRDGIGINSNIALV